METNLLIVGQGLAGTVLGWELERAGVPFRIADEGHARAASRVAAGIINPITGQRIVKSWRVDTLLPLARETYRAIEGALGVPLWREMRVRRLFREESERRVLAEKQTRGDLLDYAGASDGDGFWIEGAARVDAAALMAASRERWRAAGVLREERVDLRRAREEHSLVIDCTGALRPEPGEGGPAFDFVPWQFSKGECLTIAIDGLAPDVVLNCRHWVVPLEGAGAKVGATHGPGRCDATPTEAARTELEEAAARMTARTFTTVAHEAGVRSYLADKKPVVGRHPTDARLGVMNGLGAKGGLFAPALARQWVRHLVEGASFDPELDVARWWRTPRKAGPSQKSVVRR